MKSKAPADRSEISAVQTPKRPEKGEHATTGEEQDYGIFVTTELLRLYNSPEYKRRAQTGHYRFRPGCSKT